MRAATLAILVLGTALTGLRAGGQEPKPRGAAARAWDEATGMFAWAAGEVRLPSGTKYERQQGEDSYVGKFTSKDGSIMVVHDIGEPAGAYAQRSGSASFEEKTVEGARVWIASTSKNAAGEITYAVSFPDNGCANFFAASKRPEAGQFMRDLAASFRPRNTAHGPASCGQR